MDDLNDDLVRASALAHLEEILAHLQAKADLGPNEKSWFRDLLFPLETPTATNAVAHLISEQARSRAAGYAMLDLIAEDLSTTDDVSKFQRQLESWSRLVKALSPGQQLDEEHRQTAINLTRRLRRHLIGNATAALERAEIAPI